MVPTPAKMAITVIVFIVSLVSSFIAARRKKREKMASVGRSEPDFDF